MFYLLVLAVFCLSTWQFAQRGVLNPYFSPVNNLLEVKDIASNEEELGVLEKLLGRELEMLSNANEKIMILSLDGMRIDFIEGDFINHDYNHLFSKLQIFDTLMKKFPENTRFFNIFTDMPTWTIPKMDVCFTGINYPSMHSYQVFAMDNTVQINDNIFRQATDLSKNPKRIIGMNGGQIYKIRYRSFLQEIYLGGSPLEIGENKGDLVATQKI